MIDIRVKNSLFGKRVKADVDGQRYLFKKENGIYKHIEPSKLEKKIVSFGLIPAMLWVYSAGNLFGKTKEDKKDYEQIEKYVSNLEELVETPVPANPTIPSEVIKQLVYNNNFKGWKYDLEKNKLVPYSEENNNNSATKDNTGKKSEEKKDKKGLSTGAIVGIVLGAAALGTGAYFLLKGKKSENNNGPTPDNPDLTVICYTLNGTKENNAVALIDGQKFNTSNGQYTFKDIGQGSHSVDFEGNVWSQWLYVRDSLNGSNIEKKDVADTSANVNVTSNKTIYLVKIPSDWDMNTIAKYLEEFNSGLYKFKNSLIPVVVHKEYTGDTTEAERVIDSNLTQMNDSQKKGEFDVRQRFEKQSSANDPKIDIRIKDIHWTAYTHGEILNGFEITNTNIQMPGRAENVRYRSMVEELFEGITHTDQDELYNYVLDGESYKEILKQVMMVWAHSDPGMRFTQGSSSAQTASKVTNNSRNINPEQILLARDRYENPAVTLNRTIGKKGNVGVSLSGRGRDKSINFSGNYNLGRGNLFFNSNGRDILTGVYQNIFGHDISVTYDSLNKQAKFVGGIKPIKNTSVNIHVNNLVDMNNVFLSARYDGKNIGAAVAIDNIVNPNNITVQTNIDVKDLSAFVNFCHNKFGYDMTLAGVSYRIGDVALVANASSMGKKLNSFDIGVLAKTFSLLYGKDILGKDKISVSVNYQF